MKNSNPPTSINNKVANTPLINNSRIIANRKPILFKELSYEIVGALFEVYNSLKYGHREKTYQKAMEEELKSRNLKFKREVYYPVYFKDKIISRHYLDFLIDNKIILELKIAEDFYPKDINQVLSYLKFKKLRLGILAIFAKKGLEYKRIVN